MLGRDFVCASWFHGGFYQVGCECRGVSWTSRSWWILAWKLEIGFIWDSVATKLRAISGLKTECSTVSMRNVWLAHVDFGLRVFSTVRWFERKGLIYESHQLCVSTNVNITRRCIGASFVARFLWSRYAHFTTKIAPLRWPTDRGVMRSSKLKWSYV
jgi:hypothetical protein